LKIFLSTILIFLVWLRVLLTFITRLFYSVIGLTNYFFFLRLRVWLNFLEVRLIPRLCFRVIALNLKELYTSETTLAQRVVLTPLNNEFKIKIWNSSFFMLKNPPIFLKKICKNQFLAFWRGLIVFMFPNKVFYFYI